MALIYYFSAQSGEQLNGWLPMFRRWLPGLSDFNPMHYAAYCGLALTVSFGLGMRSATWRGLMINVAICAVYGATDEWHQVYVPMRYPDWHDLLNDIIGASAAGLLVLLILRIYLKRHANNCPR